MDRNLALRGCREVRTSFHLPGGLGVPGEAGGVINRWSNRLINTERLLEWSGMWEHRCMCIHTHMHTHRGIVIE